MWTQLFCRPYPRRVSILSPCPCRLRVGPCLHEEWTHVWLLCRLQDQLQALLAPGMKTLRSASVSAANRPGAPSCGFTQEAEGLLFNIPDQREELKHPRACLPCEKACLPAAPNGLLEALKMPRAMLACRPLEVTGSPWQLFLLWHCS